MTFTLDPPLPSTSTPDDYHRIHFDPSQLPSKRIVGLLACQRDPLLQTFCTTVLSSKIATITAPPSPKGKIPKKKGKNTPASSSPAPSPNGAAPNGASTPVEKGKLWEVELVDTIIFPEGGGQPFDTGKLVVQGPGDDGNEEEMELVVEGCLRRKLVPVHLIRVPPDQEGAMEGLQGKRVSVKVDWERRMDHMSIHTAQHLLSAVLDTFAEGLPTLSWSMPAHPSLALPYVELPRALTWAEVAEVEKKCNDYIQENPKVWVDVDVQAEDYVKVTAAGVRENRGIPSDYTDGVIRHINIDGIDKNACCGTQLPSLSSISFIHILPPSTPSTSSKPTTTPTRLWFVAGPRAIPYLQQISRTLSLTAQVISVGRGDLVERIGKMDDQRRETLGREKDLRNELAKTIAENAVRNMGDGGVIWIQRTEKSTHDFEFLGMVASTITTSFSPSPTQSASSTPDRKTASVLPVVMISSSPPTTAPSLLLIHSSDPDRAKNVNEKLKSLFESGEGKGRYRGGGAKGRYMCKIEGKWGKEEDGWMNSVVQQVRTGIPG